MPPPIAIVSVTNDLTTDQRADRTCRTLEASGYRVLLTGRLLPTSKPLKPRSYQTHRNRLLFRKGPWFYAEYNITLFFFLLFRRWDLIVSNDLDTLPANYLAFRIKKMLCPKRKRPLLHLHDCHEYFRGVPELAGRPATTAIWKWLEDRIFPKLERIMAVNDSIARLYSVEYHKQIMVVRNVPLRKSAMAEGKKVLPGVPDGHKVILYQGAVNVGRGLEEAILAMKYMKVGAVLAIAGTGDIYDDLTRLAKDEKLENKVIFTGQIPMEELHSYTMSADIGLSIEKDISVNYHFCLPNKFLDYIQANVPVLVSPFPEMKTIVDRYRIGEYLESHDPQKLAAQLEQMLNNPEKLEEYRRNSIMAAEELCWEKEEIRLTELGIAPVIKT